MSSFDLPGFSWAVNHSTGFNQQRAAHRHPPMALHRELPSPGGRDQVLLEAVKMTALKMKNEVIKKAAGGCIHQLT